jgi:uncharacterized C2H2 Zn-finger protein
VSPIWEHATKCVIDGTEMLKCNRCSKMYKWCESTTNMKNHLDNDHAIAYSSNDDESHESGDDDDDNDNNFARRKGLSKNTAKMERK